MPVPFPKMHIAESTINRILNALDDFEHTKAPVVQSPMAPPIAPNPIASGLQLDDTLQRQPAPLAPPEGAEDVAQSGAIGESLMGGSPFNGALIATEGL